MTYVGGFAGAVIGLFLRYPLRGRLPDARIFLIQEALFVFGVGVGLFLDVREACMEAAEHQVVNSCALSHQAMWPK